MNKLICLAFMVGCTTNNTTTTDITPTASGVFPAQGFAGRTERVQISGNATTWTSAATLDFGAGITVSNITVASTTDIFADIAIDGAATAGFHDVVVTDTGTFTLTQAFEIALPISVEVPALTQGSVSSMTIHNVDTEHPFDSTAATDDQGNTVYPNIVVTAPTGVNAIVSSVGDNVINLSLQLDIDAASGTLSIASGATSPITSQAAVTVTPRTATALTSGTAVNGSINNNSYLYTITAAANPSEVDFAVTLPTTSNLLAVIVLGPSGKFSDFVTSNLYETFAGEANLSSLGFLDASAGPYYIVVQDLDGASGYNFSLTGHTAAFTDTGETGVAHATVATGQTLAALPALITPAAIASTDTKDIYKFTGVAGKQVHAITYGDDNTDTAVEIDDTACTNPLTQDPNGNAGAQDNGTGGEDAIAGPLTTAAFCVIVTKGSAYTTAHTDYKLAVWLEAAQ